ncbi:MAG: metal-dependent hydrolase [Nanoarchaeota archaeon]
MMFKTHLAFGFLISLLIVKFFPVPYPLLFIPLVTILSGLPDIDHPKSKYGRKLFFLSIPISLFFKHRGFFHSIFPPLIGFFILGYFDMPFLGLALVVGYCSHLLGDCITKEGINFLHPFSTFRIQGPLRTGHVVESFLFIIIMLANAYFILIMLNVV